MEAHDYPPQPLQGHPALIAGGLSGNGRATALELARQGAAVFAFGREKSDLYWTFTEAAATGVELEAIATGPADFERIEAAFSTAENTIGTPEVFVYHPQPPAAPAQWGETVRARLFDYIDCMYHALTRMKPGGRIAIVSVSEPEVRQIETESVLTGSLAALTALIEKEATRRGLEVRVIPSTASPDDTAASLLRWLRPQSLTQNAS